MIQLYKNGGPHSKKGFNYSFAVVSAGDAENYVAKGWVRTFEELSIIDADFTEVETEESGSKYESELRESIKALGGSPAGRSSIKTLENQLAKLEIEHEQD